jgi:hypothetical protein
VNVKAKKVLKRLAKIDALISEVAARCSKYALPIRQSIRDANAAFSRVKKAVNVQASSDRKDHGRAGIERASIVVKKAGTPPRGRVVRKSAPGKKAVTKAAFPREDSPRVAVAAQTPAARVA